MFGTTDQESDAFMPTPAFHRYIAPARAYPQLWRLGLGIGMILVFHLLWLGALMMALRAIPGVGGVYGPQGIGTTPGMMVLLLMSFAGLGLGTILAVRLVHRRGAGTLIGHAPTALRHFVLGAALILVVNGAGLALGAGAIELEPNLSPAVWLAFLPLALVALLIQTGAEEAVFRGYLQQQLAARFSSALVWMLLPSIAFGFLHFEPGTTGDNALLVVAVTGIFGLMAADLTARSGTLGLAWGLHFANNIFAMMIIAPQGDLSGLALYRTPFGQDDTEMMPALLAADVVLLALIWGGCRFALRRG
jgi:uncharacterized protein